MKEIISKPIISWPSGIDKAILSLNVDIKHIAEKFSLPIIHHKDELSSFFGTFFEIEEIGDVALMEREYPPGCGVSVYVDYGVNTGKAISFIKEALELSDNQISWSQKEV